MIALQQKPLRDWQRENSVFSAAHPALMKNYKQYPIQTNNMTYYEIKRIFIIGHSLFQGNSVACCDYSFLINRFSNISTNWYMSVAKMAIMRSDINTRLKLNTWNP